MINIPFIALIFQGIPEEIAVVTLAFVIARVSLRWSLIILIGAVLGVTAYLVRLLPIPFGVHTIVLLILLFLSLLILGKADPSSSLLASFLSYLALAVTEFLCLSLIMPICGVTPRTLLIDPVKRILLGEPSVLLIFLISYVTYLAMKTTKRVNHYEFFGKYQS